MSALAPDLTLPDVSGLAATIPWYVVDRLQGRHPSFADPARALLDLWPLFRRQGPARRDWTGNEEPLEVLTALWRDFRSQVQGEPFVSLDLDVDGKGYFVAAVAPILGEDMAMQLYWADLRHLPRLRDYSPGLWDFVSDGLAVLSGLGVSNFTEYLDSFEEFIGEVLYDCPCEVGQVAVDSDAELRRELDELKQVAVPVLDEVWNRAWSANKTKFRSKFARLTARFERRVRRAAVGPDWVQWGRSVLTAARDMGNVQDLLNIEAMECGDFYGVDFARCLSLFWYSPRLTGYAEDALNADWNDGGFMSPALRVVLRGDGRRTMEHARVASARRALGLRAACRALEGFNELCEAVCGEIHDPE